MARFGRILVLMLFGGVMAAGAGCGGPTSLELSLSLGPGVPSPDTLSISLYAKGRIGAPATLPLSTGHSLPGTVILGPLDGSAPDFRVQVDGLYKGILVAQAAHAMKLTAGVRNQLALVLGPPLDDQDGDGVPDVIDDCPSLADPDQRCALTPGDGATPILDGGGPPSPKDGGALPCPKSALFCDDFETGDTSKWPQRSVAQSFNLTVGSEHVYRGKSALSVVPAVPTFIDLGIAQGHGYVGTSVQAGNSPGMWARAYAFFPTGLAASETFLELTGVTTVDVGAGAGGQWAVLVGGQSSAAHTSNRKIPSGTWSCVELGLDTLGSTVSLYVDGARLLDFQALTNDSLPPDQLRVGVVGDVNGQVSRVFIDDVAIGPTRIGCE